MADVAGGLLDEEWLEGILHLQYILILCPNLPEKVSPNPAVHW